jgi:predicted NAD/FAD-binding protein
MNIAIIGTGIAGMSAAWLLAKGHAVTVYEQAGRAGGHANTVEAQGAGPVDTGFIVYNEPCYPNLTALFRHLGVPTKPSEMSFAVSLDGGALEYGGNNPAQLFAQGRNLLSPRFWSMVGDILRFYRMAPGFAEDEAAATSLGDYLDRHGFGRAFQEDHLMPMAAAIWSTPAGRVRDYPAAAFIRFWENHGLLRLTGRPAWRTVDGGSRAYVSRLTAPYADRMLLDRPVTRIERSAAGVTLHDATGAAQRFDHVVIATHADQALALLADPSPAEARLLGAIAYTRNAAVLHSDTALMPRRRNIWSSWNYLGERGANPDAAPAVTYWMNRLQGIPEATPLFVTLNPVTAPRPETVIRSETYHHPLFDRAAIRAQHRLWELQGQRNTWYCGAWFGSGFHEDGLQAGLAAAEALGGVRRPWTVPNASGRIHLGPAKGDTYRPAA